MIKFVLVLDLLFVVVSTGSCPKDYPTLNFLYESFQCTPVHNKTDDCPTSYDCSIINQFEDKCYFNGKHYEEHILVVDNVAVENCFGCSCESSESFSRTMFSCFEASRVPTFKLNESCVYKEWFDRCSTKDSICPPFSKCILEGETFSEDSGKFYHPKDNCTKCMCTRGAKDEGVIECQKQHCIDLLTVPRAVLARCATFYDDRYRCCPSDWICPKDFDIFEEDHIGIHQKFSGEFCFYGPEVLNKTEIFFTDRYIKNEQMPVVCECILPPFVTCFPRN